MKGKIFRIAAIIVVVAFIFPARAGAATITVNAADEYGRVFIDISGNINLGDDDAFRINTQHLSADRVVVSLVSRGGNPLVAMQIGEWVHKFGWGTYVPSNATCASACALIWIAGAPRMVGSPAHIGFHAAFDDRTGEEIGVANAVIGAYLTKLGLGYEAVICATASSPNSVWWLPIDGSKTCGISWFALSPARGERLASAPSSPLSKAARAEVFVTVVETAESYEGVKWDVIYDENVDYYGKRLTRQAIIMDKHGYAARWPQRKYEILTIQPQCNDADNTCVVTGLVAFNAQSADRWSHGVATYSYTLKEGDKNFLIIAENGSIVQRQSSKDAAVTGDQKIEIARQQWLVVPMEYKDRFENYLQLHPDECSQHDPFAFTVVCFKRLMASQSQSPDITSSTTPQIQIATHPHTTTDLHLRAAPDPHAPDVLGPPPNDQMPRGSEVTITDECQIWHGSGRGYQDADNVWCPVSFNGQSGWANAFYLEINGNQRVACVMYPASNGCAVKQ
jgi:hypothetical protein